MNILHIVNSLEPGGLERVVLDLARGLRARGIQCHLACLETKGDWYKDEDWDGCWTPDAMRLHGVGKWRDLAGYVREHRIDLIHSHNPRPHVAGVITHVLTGRPLVHTKHGRNYPGRIRRVWLNRMLALMTHRIVAVSQDAADVANRIERISCRRIRCIHNGVHIAPLDNRQTREARVALRKQYNISARAVLIGSVGRLSPEKNYGLLLSAAVLAQALLPDFDLHLVFVGDGNERDRLEAEAQRLKMGSRVYFAGMQSDPSPWYAAMDVFCLSSTTEGTSLTLLEAGSHGLPAVVTDVGGNAEIVADELTGLVVPSQSQKKLAGALMRLSKFPELRSSMGEAARQRIQENYSLDKMVEQYIQVYEAAKRDF